ncbi:hypothetical protein ACU686_04920 [Yinghuangia aomiensis]
MSTQKDPHMASPSTPVAPERLDSGGLGACGPRGPAAGAARGRARELRDRAAPARCRRSPVPPRVVNLVVLALMAHAAHKPFWSMVGSWDGEWFRDIADYGYVDKRCRSPRGQAVLGQRRVLPRLPVLSCGWCRR